jgi:GxxExxY protein
MHTDEHRLNSITERVIGCAFAVLNGLGCGFLEKVYESALLIELQHAGLNVAQQVPFDVMYRGQVVGQYCADLVVEGSVLVELKAVSALTDVHTAQCLNYLKASNLKLCLLLNFARPKLEIKRIAN